MYEVKNRSVYEHELYSFNIERENLKVLYQANMKFIEDISRQEMLSQLADYSSLKGAVFKRRVLSPKRLRGVGALVASWKIYAYLPYLAVYLGSTVPLVTACAAGLYGMLAFADSETINEIRVIDSGEN